MSYDFARERVDAEHHSTYMSGVPSRADLDDDAREYHAELERRRAQDYAARVGGEQ